MVPHFWSKSQIIRFSLLIERAINSERYFYSFIHIFIHLLIHSFIHKYTLTIYYIIKHHGEVWGYNRYPEASRVVGEADPK